MKKLSFVFVLLLLSSSVSFSVSAEESFFSWLIDFSRHKGVAPVNNKVFNEECGACHFPYQPGLLPEQSWRKLFSVKQLDDHFGDSADLDEEIRVKLMTFAIANSADKSRYKRSRKVMVSLDDGQYPLRITETPYIKTKHNNIPDKLVRDNEKVKSLSYCDKCHKKAESGIYDDDTVFIPGYGWW